MDSLAILIVVGFIVGTLGTLIGAGGGFILVPILLFTNPGLKPEMITAISMAIVALNALSGTLAYAEARRIDYKAGVLFALFTIPGSILGALATKYISKQLFDIFFGALLLLLAFYLFFRKEKSHVSKHIVKEDAGWRYHFLIDKSGAAYSYSYNSYKGILISIVVGFVSPILGIGGGIIHVPALVNWLNFPVYIATATSHFILLIMSAVSVIVHVFEGNYNDPHVLHLTMGLAIGVVAGAQLGAYLSHQIKGKLIIRALALSLGLVGIRILFESL